MGEATDQGDRVLAFPPQAQGPAPPPLPAQAQSGDGSAPPSPPGPPQSQTAPPKEPPPGGAAGSAGAGGAKKPLCFTDAVLLPNDDDPMGIDLQPYHPRVVRPPEMRELERDIFAVERVIRVLFDGDRLKPQRRRFFTQLRATARAGMCGDDYDIDTGKLDLTLTQDAIADAFPLLRDALWLKYFRIVVLFTAIFGVVGCLLYYRLMISPVFGGHNHQLLMKVGAFPQICVALAWIPFGVPIGIFLEFVFRMGENVSYDGLLAINPGRWQPWRRTASTVVTAYVFAFLMAVGFFQIGVAGVTLTDFIADKPWVSVLIGFVTGFAFPYVRDLVTTVKPEDKKPGAGDTGQKPQGAGQQHADADPASPKTG